MIFTYEINLFAAYFSDRDGIATAQKFHVNDILQDQIDIFFVSSEHRFPNPVISDIVFLVDGEYLLTLSVLAFYLVEQESVSAGLNVAQYCFR